jgi:branched-chain amino acid transport system ATP-binding protein
MLQVSQLCAFYGSSQVLRGVDLHVDAGEIVSLLGRNGSGRSTTVKALMGLVSATGSVRWKGRELQGLAPYRIAQARLGYVPESRDVFPGLSVEQNLALGLQRRRAPARWALADMYRLFPALQERRHNAAGTLSGGEQQMLTLCRTLMGDPGLIMIDEPTEGLAPQIVAQVADFLRALRQRGVAVLLVEQKLAIALEVADRCLVMGQGRIVFGGSPGELRRHPSVGKEWLEI